MIENREGSWESAFEEALFSLVQQELRRLDDVTYCVEAIEVADARNLYFRILDSAMTDESRNIYRLTDLCMLNEMMEWVPDRNRIRSVAHSSF